MLSISIIMPSYNQRPFLRQAIDSVLSQSGSFRVELIVVDGISTDGSVDVLYSYGDRIRIHVGKDQCQSDALNKGLAMASSDVVGWLNSDDLYLPNALARVADTFITFPDTPWLYGNVTIIDESGQRIRCLTTSYKTFRMRRFSIHKLIQENWLSSMGVFWKREVGEQIGTFRTDLRYSMDYNYWLRMASVARPRFINEYLAAFRWYERSISGSNWRGQLRESRTMVHEMFASTYPWSTFLHDLHYYKTRIAYSMGARARSLARLLRR